MELKVVKRASATSAVFCPGEKGHSCLRIEFYEHVVRREREKKKSDGLEEFYSQIMCCHIPVRKNYTEIVIATI